MVNVLRTKQGGVVLGVIAAFAVAVPVALAVQDGGPADGPSAAERARAVQQGTRAVAVMPDTVPATQVAAFPTLREPADDAPPPAVRDLARSAGIAASLAPNPDLSRAIAAPDDAEQAWSLVPGAEGLCLLAGDGSVCSSTSDAARGLLVMFEVEPPQVHLDADGTPTVEHASAAGRQVFRGVAPTGVTSITAIREGRPVGETDVAATGAYRLTVHGADRLTLTREDGPPLTVDVR